MTTPEQKPGTNPESAETLLQKPTIRFGQYLPDRLLTVSDIASWGIQTAGGFPLDENLINQVIGGEDRRIAEPGEDTLSMGIGAAQQAMAGNGNVDFLYFSTSFPQEDPNQIGAGIDFSDEVAKRLFLSTPKQNRINVHTACAGVVEAFYDLYKKDIDGGKPGQLDGARVLITASEMYQGGKYMVQPGEEGDPGNSVTIFSDGSKAVSAALGEDMVIEYADNFTGFTPEEHAAIRMPIRYDLARGGDEGRLIMGNVPGEPDEKIFQDGHSLLRIMGPRIQEFVGKMFEKSGMNPSAIDAVIPHPGSLRMTKTVTRELNKLGLDSVLSQSLNMSSASIPNAMDIFSNSGEIKNGNRLLLLGFGGGLRITGAVVKLGGRV